MEERLKQRLVGAVVLVSLAVVFVPILFDMPHDASEETSAIPISGIPERPRDGFGPSTSDKLALPQTPRLDAEVERERSRNESSASAGDHGVSAEAPDADTASISSVATASTPAAGTRSETSLARSDPTPAAKKPDGESGRKPAVEASNAGGWTVQLGSFLKSENALALQKRLEAKGYPAFVESGPSAQGQVSRVFVGPMPEREQAKNSAAKLRREMELEGIVVPYPGG